MFLSRQLPTLARGFASTARVPSRVVLSGIQPTGIPHLGNYFGALTNWVHLQKHADSNDALLYMVVGWHALTLPQDPLLLAAARDDMLAVLLAVGLDPKRSIIFHQDHNRDHVELAWIFNCVTSMGTLRRMTTWKSRLAASKNMSDNAEMNDGALNAGLFTYPVLMAADILVYNATHVPVGDDQTQHLQLARDIVERFNHIYPSTPPIFTMPNVVKTPSQRILSLRDPTSKMSKSAPDATSRILITDTYPTIAAKIRVAVTDSIVGITFDPLGRPGTANLLKILAACTDEKPEDVALRYGSKNHGDLKRDVVDAIEAKLKGPRAEFERLRVDETYLKEVAKDGAERAKMYSGQMIKKVRQAIGLP